MVKIGISRKLFAAARPAHHRHAPPIAAAAKTFGPKAAAFGARILGCYPRFSNMGTKRPPLGRRPTT